MKFSKQYPKWKMKRLYGIYIYFGYNKIDSFERFCKTYNKGVNETQR